MKKYVIIGTGAAGYAAAKAIRKQDEEGQIVLIGREPHAPYFRPKLSHLIGQAVSFDDLQIEAPDKLADEGIQLKLGRAVVSIDRTSREVSLEDGEAFCYDRLLIATGANPFVPPFEGQWTEQMAAIRSFDDLIKLNEGLKTGNRAVVIGGGLLGLEAAWALKKAGKSVRIVEFFNTLLPRQLDPELGRVFQGLLEDQGLVFRLGDSLVEAKEGGCGLNLTMKSGQNMETDHLVFSVGVRAETRLAKEAGLEVNRGIIVDVRLQSSDPLIYAAGDAVELNGQGFGLWTQATDQGRIAGANMAGGHETYRSPAPFTLLNIAGIKLFSIGDIQDYDKTIDAFDEDKKRWKRLYVKGDQVVGGVLIGDTSQMQRLKGLVKGQGYIDSTRSLEELLV